MGRVLSLSGRVPLLAALLAGCGLDNGLAGKDDDGPGFDSGDDPPLDTAGDSDPPPPDEECNGLDDDGDGVIDEGFPDSDGDGRADCVEGECPPLDLGSPGPIPVVDGCGGGDTGGEVTDDPWSVEVQWQFAAPAVDASATSSWVQPVIGNLTDDNGDGMVDADDSPEVVVTMFGGGQAYVVAIDGATGIEQWAYEDGHGQAVAAIADIDADGRPDVVTADSAGYTLALDGDGSVKWTATDLAVTLGYVMVTVADLDEDGQPEVVSDNLVLDGADGSLLWEMDASTFDCPYQLAAVGDIDDADADQEVVYCGVVYDSDGTKLWDSGERGSYGLWPLLIQADADPQAEIGFVGARWSLWEHDGGNRFRVDYPALQKSPGPPCAGDFDGDGAAEVAFPAWQELVLYELDGTVKWSAPMEDLSGLAGCSGFDVNGDGRLEVLFADETSFRVYDGLTGAILYENPDHASYTAFEYPTVADIDHDGHAEIVITNSYGGSLGAVTAFEHAGSGWPAAGETWAVHDFAITNVDEDGSVPRHPENSWARYNVYRARVAQDELAAPDLRVTITDVCVADCTYGPAALAVQVDNQGGSDVAAGGEVAVYALHDAGASLIAVLTLPAVPAGMRIDAIELPLTVDQVGSRGFRAVVDDDGTGAGSVVECDETNNEDEWADAWCP